MKWIGAILILFTCTWVGIDIARNYSRRPRQIKELLHALQIMEAEMVYGQEPIRQVFIQLSKQLGPPIAFIFYDLSEHMRTSHESLEVLWERVLNEKWKYTSMKSNEKEVLLHLGQSLGVHDLEHQRKQIHLAHIHLSGELDDANQDDKRFSKLFRALGVLSGLLLMLIFI
ncbi:stage III sporulation protein AB [Halalkalibacillus sediminis]|uniref:Stage III sporulation protein AB n=1 Tax=Halalkalibacillus sediminis TaxID=2018042 RepID=A0A2I0QX92_9BACI|nr:stage III sporulation protein SpoIIIAB [Halalkalibacillus sediminis]PKR78966.1 stage III sporulation protein AB [Halalkalibacillus sediminis]